MSPERLRAVLRRLLEATTALAEALDAHDEVRSAPEQAAAQVEAEAQDRAAKVEEVLREHYGPPRWDLRDTW